MNPNGVAYIYIFSSRVEQMSLRVDGEEGGVVNRSFIHAVTKKLKEVLFVREVRFD